MYNILGGIGIIFAHVALSVCTARRRRWEKIAENSSQDNVPIELSARFADCDVSIVIDIGSSSIRCSSFLAGPYDGYQPNQVPHSFLAAIPGSTMRSLQTTSANGIAEVSVIVDSVNEVVDKCIMFFRRHGVKKISSIGFSSLAMSLFGVDQSGHVMTPLFNYASPVPMDSSSLRIMDDEDERQTHYKNTGTVLHHPCYASLHLRQFYSDNTSPRVHRWITLSSYIISQWTDTVFGCPISYSEASWWGLLGIRSTLQNGLEKISWDDAAIQRLGPLFPVDSLPALCDFDEFNGYLSQFFAQRWPELATAKIYLAVGDGAAANVGSQYIAENALSNGLRVMSIAGCVTIGTSAAVRVIVPVTGLSYSSATKDEVRLAESASTPLWRYRIDKRRFLVGGALTDGGSLVQWYENCFGAEKSMQAREHLAKLVCIQQSDKSWTEENMLLQSSRVPIILPFWSGERSTGWHMSATGTVSGITHKTDSCDIYIGILEAIAFRLHKILSSMYIDGVLPGNIENSHNKDTEIVSGGELPILATTGGALEDNRAFCQLLADVTGYAVLVGPQTEVTSFGVALLIAEKSNLANEFHLATINDGESDMLFDGADYMNSFSVVSMERVKNIVYAPRSHMYKYYKRRIEAHDALYMSLFSRGQQPAM